MRKAGWDERVGGMLNIVLQLIFGISLGTHSVTSGGVGIYFVGVGLFRHCLSPWSKIFLVGRDVMASFKI